jgi:D-lactate dehydrogenase
MKVLFYSSQNYDKESFQEANANYKDGFSFDFCEAHLNEKTAKLACGYKVISAFVNDDLSAKVLEILKANGVEIVALRCAGYNNVDLNKAKELDIKVVRVPEYSPYAVAEHSCALAMTLNRKTHRAFNRTRDLNFKISGLRGFDMHAKTIGIVGFGRIGQIAAKIFHGFGMEILVFDPFYKGELEHGRLVSFDELLKNSDIISLYCPLNKDTKHIINENSISKMKDGVMLINTSRGGLIDTKAVIEALKSEKIKYLGIDVYEEEADIFFEDHEESMIKDDVLARLLTFPNVIVTGHQAYFTQEALEEIARVTLNNINEFIEGKKLINLV